MDKCLAEELKTMLQEIHLLATLFSAGFTNLGNIDEQDDDTDT